MKVLAWLIVAAAVLALVVLGAGQLGLLAGSAPDDLGVSKGKLKPPSSSRNSVSSQAGLYPEHPQREYATIDPLKFTGDGMAAMARLAGLLKESKGTVIVKQQSDYLYAQSSTRFLKFTDDVEFWLDASEGVIHMRSASRLGRNDLGVNRARMEAIRARFQQ